MSNVVKNHKYNNQSNNNITRVGQQQSVSPRGSTPVENHSRHEHRLNYSVAARQGIPQIHESVIHSKSHASGNQVVQQVVLSQQTNHTQVSKVNPSGPPMPAPIGPNSGANQPLVFHPSLPQAMSQPVQRYQSQNHQRPGVRTLQYTHRPQNDFINRERRHSDGHQNTHYSQQINNNCQIHGNNSITPLYRILSSEKTLINELPNDVKAIHKSHRCLKYSTGDSNSVSNMVSSRTSPASTPSTPTDSRRIPLHRNAFTPNSTPSRSASKSSLSNISQTTRSSAQKSLSEYMPLCEVQKGLEKGEIIEGVLRINPRNFSDAYISAPGGVDLYVGGMIDRNRAFNGDRVAVKVYEPNNWKILDNMIRMHWDEWGEQLEELIKSCKKSNKTDKSSQFNAQNDLQIDTIYETGENCQSSDNITEPNDLSRNEAFNNQMYSDSHNSKCNDSKKIDKIEALDESNLASALPQNNIKNEIKKKKKRSRSKKNKIAFQKCSENKNCNELECNKLESLKPEVIEKVKNININKSQNKNDELSKKISQIKALKIEDFFRLSFWQKFIQKTGKIVLILEQNHSRQAGGHLQQMKDKSNIWALFVPNDSRIPRMRIPINLCPNGFLQHPKHFEQTLFVAKLIEWKNLNGLPNGVLLKCLGNAGDIEAESMLLLTENSIDFEEFPDQAFKGLPELSEDTDWKIPEKEIETRRDFRNECVFTIDPSTARDLDDALSIRQIDDNLFQVGVHIADVSYFLREELPLDEIARRRTTSVYLVQKVIPMLPRILCEKLCSLNAGEDKLTFSVVWIIDKDGHIQEEWFGRTLINSCIKLSYELAQDMIDEPNKDWKEDELPHIYGNWSYKKISECVNQLNAIAVKLRKCRFESGALKIEKIKLNFVLDSETGIPSGFSPYTYRDSNRLIEEFMLLANMAVAHKIYKSFDEKAFLRCHPQPEENSLNTFKTFCKYNNFIVDTSTSLSIQKSLDVIVGNDANISKVVAHFLLKAMQSANYICVGMQSASASFHHFALNVPLYTHFTSPIRRYADVIVHRLLAASLSYRPLISDSVEDLHRLAQKCNEKKMNSRIVSEGSARLFLNLYIKEIKKMEEKAIVVQVFDHSFDVMLLNCGVICRIYLDQLLLKQFIFQTKQGINQVILKWDNDMNLNNTQLDSDSLTQIITACLIVKVQISVNESDVNKFNAILQHPNGSFVCKPNKKSESSSITEVWKF